jgi:hypothetical protein
MRSGTPPPFLNRKGQRVRPAQGTVRLGSGLGCRILMRGKLGHGGANRFRVLAREHHP